MKDKVVDNIVQVTAKYGAENGKSEAWIDNANKTLNEVFKVPAVKQIMDDMHRNWFEHTVIQGKKDEDFDHGPYMLRLDTFLKKYFESDKSE